MGKMCELDENPTRRLRTQIGMAHFTLVKGKTSNEEDMEFNQNLHLGQR